MIGNQWRNLKHIEHICGETLQAKFSVRVCLKNYLLGRKPVQNQFFFWGDRFQPCVFSPETSLFHLDVYSTLHRKTLTHILPIQQVRSNCVISFMAITTGLTGISKCGSCVSYLGRGFFKFFTFSAFFLKFKLSFLPLFVCKLFTWAK